MTLQEIISELETIRALHDQYRLNEAAMTYRMEQMNTLLINPYYVPDHIPTPAKFLEFEATVNLADKLLLQLIHQLSQDVAP